MCSFSLNYLHLTELIGLLIKLIKIDRNWSACPRCLQHQSPTSLYTKFIDSVSESPSFTICLRLNLITYYRTRSKFLLRIAYCCLKIIIAFIFLITLFYSFFLQEFTSYSMLSFLMPICVHTYEFDKYRMLNRKIVKEFQNYSSFFFYYEVFIFFTFNWNIAVRAVVILNLVQQ